MKKHLIKLLSLCFTVAIVLSCTAITSFAAEKKLTINSEAKVNVGDKIKYTMYLSDTTEEIIGFELRLFYDSEYLELDKDSLTYEKFNNVIQNVNIDNKIPINWTDIGAHISFADKAQFLSVEFKVKKAGETEISQFVSEMYGDDMTYLKSYKWTYDITVNDKTIVKDMTPLISRDEDTLKNKQGGIVNYVDGMGEQNSPNKDNHEAVMVTEVVEATRYENVPATNGTFNFMPILLAGGAVVIIGAIVAILIIKKKEDGKTAETEDNADNVEENTDN